jgi:hypothetical protein
MPSNMSTLPCPQLDLLALKHVIESVLNIQLDIEAHCGFKKFWITTIHDLKINWRSS